MFVDEEITGRSLPLLKEGDIIQLFPKMGSRRVFSEELQVSTEISSHLHVLCKPTSIPSLNPQNDGDNFWHFSSTGNKKFSN